MPNTELEELNGLSDAEREYVLSILKEMNETGHSDKLDELLYGDFEEVPTDIVTFLHDKKYLGNALYDPDGRFTLYPYWEEKLKEIFPTPTDTAYNTVVLTGAIGLGKAQPMDSVVLTESGYRKMGELSLNDKVFGNDGNLHNIIGIFPQGKKKICRVSFNDGTSTLCCDEHLWTVQNVYHNKWKTVETKDLMNDKLIVGNNGQHHYKIPLTKPVNFQKKDVFIDPYIMGVLIGDGSIASKYVRFTSADEQIVSEVSRRLRKGYILNKIRDKYSYYIKKERNTTTYSSKFRTQVPTENLYMKAIKDYGVDVTSEHKFIPSDYLYNDVESRIELLQGLMDTDGYISKDGAIVEYCTVSERLRDDVVSLVQSLGGVCKIRIKHPKYRSKNGESLEGKTAYNIGIKLPHSICPFKLSRKAERVSSKSFEPSRFIDNIEYVGESECQCIYIDSKEHLYMTNDYIVTHNTLVAVVCLLYLLHRLLCLKDPYLHYGLQPIDKLSISLMNITLENAKGVALDKMNQMILSSDWFMSHGKMTGESNLIYVPNKHIELITASSNNQVIGRCLFANFTDS